MPEVFEYKPRFSVKSPMNLRQLAEYSGRTLTSLESMAFAMRLKHVQGTQKYSVASCNKLLNSSKLRINWQIEGYYNLKTVADMCGVLPGTVRNIMKRENIEYRRQNLGEDGAVWITLENLKKIQVIVKQSCRVKCIEEPTKQDDFSAWLASQKKKHPLVKDIRCFDTNYFPESLPLCFIDMEE